MSTIYACDLCEDVGFIYSGPLPFLSSQLPEHVQKCICNIKADCKRDYVRFCGPIHTYFGLSYASYFCVPRIVLQGMPIWWQKLFTWLIKMLPENLPDYTVRRKDDLGKFMSDPLGDYRHGNLDEILTNKEQSL